VHGASRLRPGDPTTTLGATKYALRVLARRVLELEAELGELKAILKPLVAATAPELVARHGVGTDTAGALLVASGDNPGRLRDERAFAHLCGVSPIDASSGTVVRKRLNRGGNRQANEALWRIVMVRLVSDPATRHCMERRTKEGLSKREAIRCLKRYVARELYPLLAAQALDIDRASCSGGPTECRHPRLGGVTDRSDAALCRTDGGPPTRLKAGVRADPRTPRVWFCTGGLLRILALDPHESRCTILSMVPDYVTP